MKTFKELGLNSEIMKGLKDLEFTEPSPVQEKAIPFILKSKKDLIALAQTGTGKTAAFGLPILNQLKSNEKDLFGNIKDSNNRIMDMVSSLLDISRVESGKKMEINKANFKVSKIIYNILKEEENLIKKYKVKIIKEKSLVKDVNIKVDKDRIKQVFHNIIVNAIKYSHPKGVVKIGIKSRNKKDIIYFVKDNGIGIPARQQDKVFDKFFRGSNVWESGEDGTGLGLHIAKLLVEIHKGKIWLESNKQGTTFYISLPIK